MYTSIGGSRLFPYRVALFPWIRFGLYIVEKELDSTAWTTWGTFSTIISTEPTLNGDDDAKS